MTQQELVKKKIKKRFDGYLPVVVDVETSGVDPLKNALLEVAAVVIDYNNQNKFALQDAFSTHVVPFENAVIDPKAMEINRIDMGHPFRFAVEEPEAMDEFFNYVNQGVLATHCRRAILVGHNAHFDLSFVNAAAKRCGINKTPFHAFSCFDTATLAGMACGKTILAKALKVAEIEFDVKEAHSAVYDTKKTAELFCQILNQFDEKQ